MKLIRLYIIEDNRVLREGFQFMLKTCKEFIIAVDSGVRKNTFSDIVLFNPDVIMLDLSLRNSNSMQFLKRTKKELPAIKFLLMSLISFSRENQMYKEAGAAGIILKDSSLDEFISAIRIVAEGDDYFPPLSEEPALAHIFRNVGLKKRGQFNKYFKMTEKELKILWMLNGGMNYLEISKEINIPVILVNRYITNITSKLILFVYPKFQ